MDSEERVTVELTRDEVEALLTSYGIQEYPYEARQDGSADRLEAAEAKLRAALDQDGAERSHPDEAAVEPCVCHEVAGDSPDCSWHPDEAKGSDG